MVKFEVGRRRLSLFSHSFVKPMKLLVRARVSAQGDMVGKADRRQPIQMGRMGPR